MNKFFKNSILAGLLFLSIPAKAQVNTNSQWEWIKGDSTDNSYSFYGTRGIASNITTPGARSGSTSWIDASNNLWLFGGDGIARGGFDALNDLWKFNPLLNQWTWMKGDSTTSGYGKYGIRGISAVNNTPGARSRSYHWMDNAGNLWLFGGGGYATGGSSGHLSDVWKYDPATNQWAWINGDTTAEVAPVYGRQGVAAITNNPGGRGDGVSWKDKTGNLWFFGGATIYFSGLVHFNDLWKYDISANEWTWVNGDTTTNNYGTYGMQGVASVNNKPGARAVSVGWTDNAGNLWLFGGNGFAESGTLNELNDLWKYDPVTNLWTWISGDKVGYIPGVYGTRGIPGLANKPGARVASSAFTDSSGNLFLFGGIGYGNSIEGELNDLWKYNPANNQWAWIKGDSSVYNNGVYGIKGTASDSNKPGSRFNNTSWADSSGNLYLFGGTGYATNGISDALNDLWKISVNNTVLPLTLLNFSGSPIQNNNVLLNWQTTREFNAAYFDIEHSVDGRNFIVLGFVNAASNSSITKTYSFTDNKPLATSNFYRLKIVDNDGKFSYSKIVRVNIPLKRNLQIFPNPAEDILYVEANGNNENATVQIYDASGRQVREEKIVLNGTIYFSLNIKNMPKGMYTLILKKQSTIEQQKFVKE